MGNRVAFAELTLCTPRRVDRIRIGSTENPYEFCNRLSRAVDDLTVNCVVVAALRGNPRQRSVKWFKLATFLRVKQAQYIVQPVAVQDALQLRFELADLRGAGVFSIGRVEQLVAPALLECSAFVSQYDFEQCELFDQLFERLA